MPRITVKLYATFRQHIDGKPSVELEVENGQTVRSVLDALGVPVEETRILFVNNRHAELADTLRGGETLGVFPAIGGG
jgi:molybdopterin converting factor small subunit